MNIITGVLVSGFTGIALFSGVVFGPIGWGERTVIGWCEDKEMLYDYVDLSGSPDGSGLRA